MIYFINIQHNFLLAYDEETKIVEQFEVVGSVRGGGIKEKVEKKKYKTRVPKIEKVKGRGKGKRLLPETVNEIKERINLGDSSQEIATDFGVSYATVYMLKKKMEEKSLDTLPG